MKSVTAQNPYGFCPICGAPGMTRERCPHGNDTCVNKHYYASAAAVFPPVQPIGVEPLEEFVKILDETITKIKKHLSDLKEIAERHKNI